MLRHNKASAPEVLSTERERECVFRTLKDTGHAKELTFIQYGSAGEDDYDIVKGAVKGTLTIFKLNLLIRK